MYPYLFGIETLMMYDVIGVCGYIILFYFFLQKKRRPLTPAGAEDSVSRRRLWTLLPLAVHVVAFTLGGERMGYFVSRATEFFGYVAVSSLGVALAALTLGAPPLRWLDRTVSLYLCLAAVLKLSCFCAGCCYGLPWEHGLFNIRQDETQVPIQLVEAVLYGVLFFLLRRYKGQAGQRFALFLTGYAAVRFGVQFFRADVAVFTPFHWMSAIFAAIGVVMWLICRFVGKKFQYRDQK